MKPSIHTGNSRYRAKRSLWTGLLCMCALFAFPHARTVFSQTAIEPSFPPGEVVNRYEIPDGRFLQYSRGRMFWGENVLAIWREIRPDTETVPLPLPGDRVIYVRRGTVTCLAGDKKLGLREHDIVYHEQGTTTALTADSGTAEVLEFHWPVHPGHLREAGGTIPEDYRPPQPSSRPSIPPGRIFNLAYLQYCMPQKDVLAKIVQGFYGQLNFVRIEPEAEIHEPSPAHEQLIIILGGSLDVVMDSSTRRLSHEDIMYIPKGREHTLKTGFDGCGMLMVTAPADRRYDEALLERVRLFHEIVAPLAEPDLVLDGRFGPMFGFAEGPNWLGETLLFSDQHYGGLYTIEPGGELEVINEDIVPCGTALLPNGNIAVCDTKTRSILEMTRNGAPVGTLADSWNGERFRGTPNDVICDSEGALYFTITSFSRTAGANRIFHLAPGGDVVAVTGEDEFGVPNGIALSPDEPVLYLDDDTSRYVWAFDVMPDGALANKRRFARLILHETQIGIESPKSFADGMTVDSDGNLYVAASGFIQIFSAEGIYRGGFVFPKPAFHCTFGGPEGSTLFVTCMNQIYSLRTQMNHAR